MQQAKSHRLEESPAGGVVASCHDVNPGNAGRISLRSKALDETPAKPDASGLPPEVDVEVGRKTVQVRFRRAPAKQNGRDHGRQQTPRPKTPEGPTTHRSRYGLDGGLSRGIPTSFRVQATGQVSDHPAVALGHP